MFKKSSLILLLVPIIYAVEPINTNCAKPFNPVFTEVVAEIPDNTNLPSYMDRLEQAYTFDVIAVDGCLIKFSLYREAGVRHLSPNGKEKFPYIEAIKWEPNGIHLICLSFIDDEGNQQHYADENALIYPASNILKKIDPNYLFLLIQGESE